jgi:hypothetical protein
MKRVSVKNVSVLGLLETLKRDVALCGTVGAPTALVSGITKSGLTIQAVPYITIERNSNGRVPRQRILRKPFGSPQYSTIDIGEEVTVLLPGADWKLLVTVSYRVILSTPPIPGKQDPLCGIAPVAVTGEQLSEMFQQARIGNDDLVQQYWKAAHWINIGRQVQLPVTMSIIDTGQLGARGVFLQKRDAAYGAWLKGEGSQILCK